MTLAQLNQPDQGFGSDTRYVRAPEVLWRTIPGFAVIALRSAHEDVVILSGSGLALWDELAEPRRLAEVALRFSASLGVPPDVVMSGLGEAVRQLCDRGIVQDHDA